MNPENNLPKNVKSWTMKPDEEIIVGKNGKTIKVTWLGVSPWTRMYLFKIDNNVIYEYRTSKQYPTINVLEQASELLKKYD